MSTVMVSNPKQILLENLNRVHANPNIALRIRYAMNMMIPDVTIWCRNIVTQSGTRVWCAGRNYFVLWNNVLVIINSRSFSIAGARRVKREG